MAPMGSVNPGLKSNPGCGGWTGPFVEYNKSRGRIQYVMSYGRNHVGRLRISTVALVLGGLVLEGSVVSIEAG